MNGKQNELADQGKLQNLLLCRGQFYILVARTDIEKKFVRDY